MSFLGCSMSNLVINAAEALDVVVRSRKQCSFAETKMAEGNGYTDYERVLFAEIKFSYARMTRDLFIRPSFLHFCAHSSRVRVIMISLCNVVKVISV